MTHEYFVPGSLDTSEPPKKGVGGSTAQRKQVAFVEASSQMSGVEFSTLYLLTHFDRAHWRPLIICPAEGDLPDRCRASNAEVVILPHARFFSTSVEWRGRWWVNPFALVANSVAVWLSARRLARYLRAYPPALVVTKGLLAHLYGGLAAGWSGVPCVWHLQDRVSDRLGPFFPWILSAAARLLATEIIVDAASIARQLQSFVPGSRISLIPNGVDTNEFSPEVDGAAVRAEWSISCDQVLVGVIGRLIPWKGQHLLIQAFARIAPDFPQARVVLVGKPLFDTDGYQRTLKEDAARLGLDGRVLFVGFRWDLPQVLAALDVVVHTALEKDSSPLAVVSAMASGKPIVCTRLDGTAELFDENIDGLLFTPGNVGELTAKLCELLQDNELRRRLGQAARAKAERQLNLDKFTQSCESVLARALA